MTGLVLLVEDDAQLAEVAAELLEQAGWAVALATNGRRALGVLDALRRPPAVVVTDLMMPVMDGLTLLREYARRAGPRAPVVAMSSMDGYLQEASRLGAAAVLRKPFGIDRFVRVVNDAAAGGKGPMETAPASPADEERRLRSALELQLDRIAPEAGLHRLVDHVARVFDVPICAVTALTPTQQFWTACHGLPPELAKERGGKREESFCHHAVAARAALVVTDALDNPLFSDNEFVHRQRLRFYAGAPIVDREGDALGTLCLMDQAPRAFGHFDLELLCLLARGVLAYLERREAVLFGVPEPPLGWVVNLAPDLDVPSREMLVDLLAVEMSRLAPARLPLSVVMCDVAADRVGEAARRLEVAFARGWVGLEGPGRLGVIASETALSEALASAQRALGPEASVVGVDATGAVGAAAAAMRHAASLLEQQQAA
jgi:CheY-like chemotaxis protein